MSSLLRDATRAHLQSPGSSLLIVLGLALGIGANTAIFSLVDAVLFRPLPVDDPDGLVRIFSESPMAKPRARRQHAGTSAGNSSYPVFADYRDGARSFRGLAAYGDGVPAHLSQAGGAPERLTATLVSGSFFGLLGVRPALGRLITEADDGVLGQHPVLVLSDRLWRRRFGADPAAVGATVRLNGHSFTVVGVAPPAFLGAGYESLADLWAPMAMVDAALPEFARERPLESRRFLWVSIVGRLAPGVTLEQAQAELDLIADRRAATQSEKEVDPSARVLPAAAAILDLDRRGEIRGLSFLLLGVVALVLALACADAAFLLLARGERRQHEIAVRMALGASRGRIVGQLLLEGMLLSVAAAGLGLVLADAALDVLVKAAPPDLLLPVAALSPILDPRTLSFTVGASLLVAVVFGLAPALRASRPDLVPALKSHVRSALGPGGGVRLRSAFVVFQVATASLVLVAAGLLVRSLTNASAVRPGFDTAHALAASVDLSRQGYDDAKGLVFFERMLDVIEAVPGVETAALARIVPVRSDGMLVTLEAEGYLPQPEEDVHADFDVITPRYFEAIGVGLRSGREFTRRDRTGAPPVAIVNEAFAARYWPGQEAVGRRLLNVGPSQQPLEVVGVVPDLKTRSVRETPAPMVYVPLAQWYMSRMTLVVRSAGPPRAALSGVEAAVSALDKDLPLFQVRTLEEQIGLALAQERLLALLFAAFGLLALVLAGAGLFGLVAYTTEGRTREIGIRVALGARPADVLRLILGQGLALAAGGLVIGLGLATVGSRLLQSFLFGVAPGDLTTLAGVALILGAVTFVAGHGPARRALRVDPVTALRSE